MTPADHALARQAGAALAATRWARELAPAAVESAAEDARRQTSVRPVDRLPWRAVFTEAFATELARLSAPLAPGQPIPAPAAPAGPEWGDAAHRAAVLRACRAARSVLGLCPDRLRAREAGTHLSILESWARDPEVPPFASALALVDLAAVSEAHLPDWERGMLDAASYAGQASRAHRVMVEDYAGLAVTTACRAYARATDPSGRRYAALVTEHARRLADPSPASGRMVDMDNEKPADDIDGVAARRGTTTRPGRKPSIHWAGGLDYPIRGGIMVMSPGYPCCCSGDRARKVREDGTQTWDRERVTCKTCLKLLAKKAAAVEASRRRLGVVP